MFNLPQGGEIIVILLLALVILGPEKLPDVIRRVGKTYAELKKLGQGFQDEFKSAIEEPAREMRETADLLRKSIDNTINPMVGNSTPTTTPTDAAPSTPNLRAADDPPHDEPTTDLPTFDGEGSTEDVADAESMGDETTDEEPPGDLAPDNPEARSA